MIAGVIGIGLALGLSLISGAEAPMKRFLMTYLASYCFVLSIGVGCLFFVTIMHLTRAGWSATVRRIAEIYAMCLVPMFVLFLPILIPLLTGSDAVYEWNQPGYSSHSEVAPATIAPIETLKGAFLNRGFFAIRILAYFAIWGLLAYTYLSRSLKQDETGDKTITAKLQGLAAPFLLMFAVTVVFSSFDLELPRPWQVDARLRDLLGIHRL